MHCRFLVDATGQLFADRCDRMVLQRNQRGSGFAATDLANEAADQPIGEHVLIGVVLHAHLHHTIGQILQFDDWFDITSSPQRVLLRDRGPGPSRL